MHIKNVVVSILVILVFAKWWFNASKTFVKKESQGENLGLMLNEKT